MMPPWVIILSGTSCSGKTTLAKALQALAKTHDQIFLHLEADRLFPIPSESSFVPGAEYQRKLLIAFRKSIAIYAEEGFDLIVDGLLPYGDQAGIEETLGLFKRYRIFHVAVRCSLKQLKLRERKRSDRTQGWAATQYRDLYDGLTFDLEVDTTATTADVIAQSILHRIITIDLT